MPPAVDHEPRRADDVHRLIGDRLAAELARRYQKVGEQDQQRAGPAGDFDGDLDRAQEAASFRSTYCRIPPALKYSSSL